MNILLRNLESSVDESLLLQAGELTDLHPVAGLEEVDRNLWTGSLPDGEHIREVEVKTTRSRLVAASCECDAFHKDGICAHVVAVALAVRSRITRRKEKRKAAKEKPTRSKKLTTSLILDQVDSDNLLEFVREYARQNRAFGIALKARFAGGLQSMQGEEKFSQLLESVINLARRPDRSLGKRGITGIQKVLDELATQSRQALADKHLLEVHHIQQAIIGRLPSLLGKTPFDDLRLQRAVKSSFEILHEVLQVAPPDLAKTITGYARQQFDRLVYRNHALDIYFLGLLIRKVHDRAELDLFQKLVTEQNERYLQEERPLLRLHIARFQTLVSIGRGEEAKALVLENCGNLEFLKYAIHYAKQAGDKAMARELASAALKYPAENHPEYSRDLVTILMKDVAELGSFPPLREALEQQILNDPDIQLLPKLKQVSGKKWPKIYRRLLRKVLCLPDRKGAKRLVAQLFVDLDDKEGLLNYLQQSGSIELLPAYDEWLVADHKSEVLGLYKKLLHEYAVHHLGPVSSRTIRSALDHLRSIGQNGLASLLVGEFRDHYPERHTLMEQLAPF